MKNLIYKGQSREIYRITEKGKGIDGNITYYELVTRKLKEVELTTYELKDIWEVYTTNLVREASLLKTLGNEKYKEAILEYIQVEKARDREKQ